MMNSVRLHFSDGEVDAVEKAFIFLGDDSGVEFFDKNFVEDVKRWVLLDKSLCRFVVAHNGIDFSLTESLDRIGEFGIAFHIDLGSVSSEVRCIDVGGVADLDAYFFVA